MDAAWGEYAYSFCGVSGALLPRLHAFSHPCGTFSLRLAGTSLAGAGLPDSSDGKGGMSIPSLRSFSVRNSESSTVTLALLLQISAPLRALGIHCQNAFLSFWYPAALESFLPHVARTLEKLEIAKFAVDPRVIQAGSHTPPPPITSLTRYSAVRLLSIKSFEGRPLLEDLQHLFPALDGVLSLGALDIRCREETYDHIRAVNRRAQERSGDSSLLGVWTGLDRIVCSGLMLYVLGLRCPIRLVLIDFGGADKCGRYVAGALRENPVPRLKLTLEHDLAALREVVLSPKLAEALTHLTLCLLYWNDYQYPLLEGEDDAPAPRLRWEDVLDRIPSAIRPLHRLTHLRVVIGVKLYVYDHRSPPFAPMDEYAHSFRESRFDFAGAANVLARALPRLRYIFLTTGGLLTNWAGPEEGDRADEGGRWRVYERWYIGHGWRVATPDAEEGLGERGLVELHEDVVETIIRKEELVLSERDEASAGFAC
ncbi:hypothetical protein V8D89_002940 [Ganoderma adspersum]